jgi:hypothetical protein
MKPRQTLDPKPLWLYNPNAWEYEINSYFALTPEKIAAILKFMDKYPEYR